MQGLRRGLGWADLLGLSHMVLEGVGWKIRDKIIVQSVRGH